MYSLYPLTVMCPGIQESLQTGSGWVQGISSASEGQVNEVAVLCTTGKSFANATESIEEAQKMSTSPVEVFARCSFFITALYVILE